MNLDIDKKQKIDTDLTKIITISRGIQMKLLYKIEF